MRKLFVFVFALALASQALAGERCVLLDDKAESYLTALALAQNKTPEKAWTVIVGSIPGRIKALAREAVMQVLDKEGAEAFVDVVK